MNSYFLKEHGDPEDTIVAIATPRGAGAIAIIRVSGKKALEFTGIFVNPRSGKALVELESAAMVTAVAKNIQTGELVDEVMVASFRGPRSYTGEDVVEIFCHGGNLVADEIISQLQNNGARIALPGEFTLRAFINGKMDLTQAEAVLDVINARNRRFLDASVKKLSGALGEPVKHTRALLVNLLAQIDVVIEYPEEDTPQIDMNILNDALNNAQSDLKSILDRSISARIMNEGPKIAVIGKPNVGKSSLINALLKRDRVIVSDTPGTTRDLIGDWITIDGSDFLIMDTAGITETEDKIEAEGVKRTLNFTKEADILLILIDSSAPISEIDKELLRKLPLEKQHVLILSKCDLMMEISDDEAKGLLEGAQVIKTSSKSGLGLDDVKKYLREQGRARLESTGDSIVMNVRHRRLISAALGHVNDAIENVGKVPDDILSIDIREAIDNLGEITGERTTDDLLNSIFSEFCVGK